MPNAQTNSTLVNARRFAALLAGFDVGNGCEEEALSKGRALRRMAAEANMRIVDLLELPDVRRAIDEQLRPVRKGDAGLREALERAAALQDELTERTRDVRRLAELLREREQTVDELREALAAAKFTARTGPAPRAASIAVSHSFGAESWAFEIAVAGMAAALIVMAAIH